MADPEDDEGGEDRTVVVDRDDDSTVVDRDEDHTVVIERDKTVVVDRQRRGKRPKLEAPAAHSVITLLPRRRGITVAPIEPGFGREAVEAIGPGVVETYVPREVAPPPAAGPAVPRGEDALRADAPSMPSVGRRSRKAGVLALLVFAGACVVSVIGVIVVIVWFVRS